MWRCYLGMGDNYLSMTASSTTTAWSTSTQFVGDIFFRAVQLKTNAFGSIVDILEQEPRGGATVA